MATSMRKENAKGNTGMDHGIQTQDKSYNNYREEEGVINKLNVHKKTYLKKMMVLEGEQMKNANDQFLEVRANSAQDITSKNVSIKFKNFKELIEGRGSHRTLLSLERFLFIQLVYSCMDLEMSSILLCTDVPPRKGACWVVVLKDFYCPPGREWIFIGKIAQNWLHMEEERRNLQREKKLNISVMFILKVFTISMCTV